MTCHCRSTFAPVGPAVGTNERMESLSVPFQGRQTKRIPEISGVVKITDLSFRRENCQRRDPILTRRISQLLSSAEIERGAAVAPHLPTASCRYTTQMTSGVNCVS